MFDSYLFLQRIAQTVAFFAPIPTLIEHESILYMLVFCLSVCAVPSWRPAAAADAFSSPQHNVAAFHVTILVNMDRRKTRAVQVCIYLYYITVPSILLHTVYRKSYYIVIKCGEL
jgi:hypothetical protein